MHCCWNSFWSVPWIYRNVKKHRIVIPSNKSNKDRYDRLKQKWTACVMHRWATTNKSKDSFLTRYLKNVFCMHSSNNKKIGKPLIHNKNCAFHFYLVSLYLFSLTFHPQSLSTRNRIPPHHTKHLEELRKDSREIQCWFLEYDYRNTHHTCLDDFYWLSWYPFAHHHSYLHYFLSPPRHHNFLRQTHVCNCKYENSEINKVIRGPQISLIEIN